MQAFRVDFVLVLMALALATPTPLARAQDGRAETPASGAAIRRETVVGGTPEVIRDHDGAEQLQLSYPRMGGAVYTYIATFRVVDDAAFAALRQRIAHLSYGEREALRVSLVRAPGEVQWHVTQVAPRTSTDPTP